MILDQFYCDLYCVNDLVIVVSYHHAYTILAADWLISHMSDLGWYMCEQLESIDIYNVSLSLEGKSSTVGITYKTYETE